MSRALPKTAASDAVVLQSVSGKRVTMNCPITYRAVLDAAVAPPFSFASQSVKVMVRNRLVHVAAHLKAHATTAKDGGVIDASAFSNATTTTPRAASRSGNATGVTAPLRSLLVFGVPCRVRDPNAGMQEADPTRKAHTSSPAATHAASRSSAASGAPSSAPAAAATVNPAVRTSARASSEAEASQDRAVRPQPASRSALPAGPLPYPHSPDGLLELAKAVAVPLADGDDDDDLISLLQGAPQRIYNHPTMRYMANKVKGNLATLHDVVAQIARVAPVFYAWIEDNPQKFLSALNRVGERSLQQMKEQLRLLALQAVAGQMSGDGPSRRVMTLEVNTRDGTPDVFQVEVQVGDFSDDDDNGDGEEEEEEEEVESSSLSSMYDGAEEEEEEVGSDYEEEEEETEETLRWSDFSDESGGDHLPARLDTTANGHGVNAAETEASARDALFQAGEEYEEPHRGAICLSSLPTAAAASMAPTPPSGSAPTRAGRPIPSVVAALRGTTDAAAYTNATAAPTDAQEDERLVQLRADCRSVEWLRHVYTCQADTAAAQGAHAAIMAVRPKFFAVLGEVCTALSSASGATVVAQQCSLLRRVVRCATDFFSASEEFYAQLEGEGVRSSVFGPAPQESLAAWAAVAALSRLLLCDIDTAAHDVLAAAHTSSTTSPSGPRRVGALRSLHTDNVLWSNPALHWALTRSPEELLASLLLLCRQQRAVLLWYSSHYLVKPVGKTIQTMAYVFGGTEEAQEAVALQRLKFTSKAHKSDEVADCLVELAAAAVADGTTGTALDGARRQWVGLMRSRYQQLVRPLEGDLPTPHMTSFPLYVCDTRHVLPTKEGPAGRTRRTIDSAARWWAGYCDDRNTLCADKWCVVGTLRPWNAAMAAATAHDAAAASAPAVERVALRLVKSGEPPSAEAAARLFQGLLPTERVVRTDSTLSSPAAARHTAVLCETVTAAEVAALEATASGAAAAAAAHGMTPQFVGDVHVVDVAVGTGPSPSSPSASSSVTRLAGGAEVPTHLTAVVRNFVLPLASTAASAPPAGSSGFLAEFFNMFARHPNIPAAAAARHAALATAKANDAPWLVCEYVLLDYGGAIRSLGAATRVPPAVASVAAITAAGEGVVGGGEALQPMPSVPLSRRLSEPRPISTVSRSRASSQSDSEGRGTSRHAPAAVGAVAAAEEDAARRHYARTHAIDELYEMMLGSLLEHQPTGEQNVLDHLVSFLETAGDALQDKVQHRQSESIAAVSVPAEVAPAHCPPPSLPSPQPPSAKRGSKGRPSLSRKK